LLIYEFVPDKFFQGPKWIEGDTDNLPEDLKPRSALATPKAAVKGTPKGKTFGVPKEESESGTESSDKNPDQQFESSSDQSESEDKSVPDLLSPIDFDPFKKPKESESDNLGAGTVSLRSDDPKKPSDPLKWWMDNHNTYPKLAAMAMDYLSIPGMFLTLHVFK
jgi:hypothetical protein